MKKLLKKHLHPLLLSLILIVIFVTNYTPGTFLAGWDNLMPGLNIWMNIKRSVFAVWQEYQGLGLVGGMGHACDLIRQIILLPFILVFPHSFVRYLWTFAMMALGTFGIYFGLNKLKFEKKQRLLASLFYLLNFGTIQIFWVPYEAFITFWGFFPWLIFSFLTVLKNPNKSSWKKFILWNILAIPSFYIQTLFVVYLLSLSLISLFFLRKEKFILLKSYLILFLINSFWLLPFAYFLATNSYHPREAIINRMSSEETVARNQYRGTIKDFLLLRGYYYDFPDAGVPMMKVWQDRFGQKPILIIGYTLGIICLIGLIKAPNWLRGLFFLSTVSLLSATPPFSWLNWLFRQSPFLDQVFRSPFTKFTTPAAFSFSLLFSLGISSLISLISLKFSSLITPITLISLILFSFPVFSGNFIYPKMRVKIPTEYFQVFNFFKNQPKTARISNLPQGSFWGWTFYRWGLRGSGFLWYAIEQPILDRAFDVWSLKNEQYYFVLNYALQNQDITLLENVLEKYSVEFIIFDDNITFPGEKIYAKQALKTKELLDSSSRLTKVSSFGKIDVYRFDRKTLPYLLPNLSSLLDLKKYELLFKTEENSYLFYPNPIETDWFKPTYTRCNTSLQGKYSAEETSEGGKKFIRLSAEHDDSCAIWWFEGLPLSQGWQLEIIYRHLAGHPPFISIWNENAGLKLLTEKLKSGKGWQKATFLIPPYQTEEKGLVVSFSSTSFNQFPSINDIASITLSPISLATPIIQPIDLTSTISLKSQDNLWFYSIPLNGQILNLKWQNNFLVLPQSFDKGWLALYFDGLKPIILKDHVLVNNWANAWLISQPADQAQCESCMDNTEKTSTTVYVIFWPQILEFIGFGLLFFTPLLLLLPSLTRMPTSKKSPHNPL